MKAGFKDVRCQEFPGGPVVGLRASTAGGMGSIPGEGTKILHAMRHSQNPNKTKSKPKVNHSAVHLKLTQHCKPIILQ